MNDKAKGLVQSSRTWVLIGTLASIWKVIPHAANDICNRLFADSPMLEEHKANVSVALIFGTAIVSAAWMIGESIRGAKPREEKDETSTE